MSRFDRYVLSQLLVQFGFFSLVLVAIYWINNAVQVFDQLISDGQSAGTVLAFTALTLPGVVAIVMPMSAFAAAVFTTNRLNSESELVVMQATGFSPLRLAAPYLTFGILVTVMISINFHILVPAASKESSRQRTLIANNITSQLLTSGQFLNPTGGVTFYVGELTEEGVLKGVFLMDARKPDRQTTYIANEAFLVNHETGPKLVMLEGLAQTLSGEDRRLATTRFDDFAFDIGGLISAARPRRPSSREFSTPDLLRASPENLERAETTKARFQWEAHNRITQSFLGLVAPLVGLAGLLLGAFSRFGVWRQILVAICILIVVKLVDNSSSATARGIEGGWPLQYIAIVLGLAISLGMLLWAGRIRTAPPIASEAAP